MDPELARKLHGLQACLRRQRCINGVLVAGLAGMVLLAASQPQRNDDSREIRASKIVIVDSNGEESLRISGRAIADADGSTVATFGPDGIRARSFATIAPNGAVTARIGASQDGGYLSLSAPEMTDALELMVSANSVRGLVRGTGEGIFGSVVPLGGIIPFCGGPEELELLENFELCDGSEVTREDSPIRGRLKPDLRNRFLAGADRAALNLWTDPVSGGVDTIPARPLGQTEGHALTIAQLPKHGHGAQVSTVRGSALGGNHRLVSEYRRGSGPGTPSGMDGNPGGSDPEFDVRWGTAVPIRNHTHTVTVTETGGGQSHSHRLPDVPAHDNRPSFVAVHFIIRVK